LLTAANVARSHVHVAPMSRRQQLAQSEAYATVPSCYQNILRHEVLKHVFALQRGV
jgi:hypothetical protein